MSAQSGQVTFVVQLGCFVELRRFFILVIRSLTWESDNLCVMHLASQYIKWIHT